MAETTPSALVAEGLLDLKDAAAEFISVNGRKPHVATLRRWATRGCRGHKLATVFLGNRLMTTRQAAARFLAAINSAAIADAPPHTPITAAAEKARRELDEIMK